MLKNILAVCGWGLLLISILSAAASLAAFVERQKFGPGPFIADVELLGIFAAAAGLLGGILLFVGSRLSKHLRKSTQRK